MPILNLESAEAKRHIDEINERLPNASPGAAYTLGLLSVMVFRHGVRMPTAVLDGVLKVTTMEGALEYASMIWGLRDREKELAAARETRDRYERGLKAMAKRTTEACEFDVAGPLSKDDVLEWVAMTADALLDGQEAECPVCSTHVHEGACVGDGEDEDDEDEDEPPTCDACGDTRGTCIHV